MGDRELDELSFLIRLLAEPAVNGNPGLKNMISARGAGSRRLPTGAEMWLNQRRLLSDQGSRGQAFAAREKDMTCEGKVLLRIYLGKSSVGGITMT